MSTAGEPVFFERAFGFADDGGAVILIECMCKNYTNAALVGSCLRSIHYICDEQFLGEKLVFEQDLVLCCWSVGFDFRACHSPARACDPVPRISFAGQAKRVLFVMRSCDYDNEAVLKGLALLSTLMYSPETKTEVWAVLA